MNAVPWLFFLLGMTLAVQGAPTKTILFFGDSLTAGYGLEDPADAFPGVIQKKIQGEKLPYRVVNAGVSGDTSAGGMRRLDWVLRQPVDVFVLELGANDGLRGVPPAKTQENLQVIIDRVRAKFPGVKVVLAGMMMPTSHGPEYTKAFASLFPALAEKNKVTLIPFVLDQVGGKTELNQPDGVHPTAEGHRIMAETTWKYLRPLL